MRIRNSRRQPTHADHWITIGRPADELYALFKRPETLDAIMGDAVEIRGADGDRLHWRLQAPAGRALEWDTAIVQERPNEYLHWASVAGTDVSVDGELTLRPAQAEWGTEVELDFSIDPAAHRTGGMAKALGPLAKGFAARTLRRFKSLAETGEVPTTKHNPSARKAAQDS